MITNDEKRRHFTGKLSGFANNVERNFWNKNLKAYLRGWSQFTFGISKTTGHPQWYPTAEAWK
jgi:hypothetical protein